MSKVGLFARMILPFCLLLVARAPAQLALVGKPEEEPGFGLYAAEAGGALLLSSALTASIILGADAAVPRVGDPEVHSIISTYLAMAGAAVVCPLGSAAGASIVGGIKQQYGNFGAAYLGALLGLPVGYGIAAGGLTIPVNSDVLKGTFVVAGCLAPPVCATVGYNVSRQSGAGYGLLERRLIPPSIGVSSWSDLEGQTVVATNVRLLTVRF